jgi:ComF family protein
MKELIHEFKYRSRISLGNILSGIMIDSIKNYPGALDGVDAITFVPIQDRRLRQRDFNQSRVLASKLSKALSIPLIDALKKVRSTRPQNELSREDRLRNLEGAFAARNARDLNGLKLLLVDDVMATGTTLDQASRTLLENGAKEIICFTLSRGV